LAQIGPGSGITRTVVVAFYTSLGNAGRKGDYGRTHTATPQVSMVHSANFRAGWVRRAVHSEEEANRDRAYLPAMGSGERGPAHRAAQRGAVPDPVILEIRYRPPESDSETRIDLALQLNAEIYKAGQSSAQHGDEEFELTFFCACRCMAEVKRSLRDYVVRGAVIAGHSRPAAHR
jgi:hypothetical protein